MTRTVAPRYLHRCTPSSLPQQFLLLELDDVSGLSLLWKDYERNYGLAGAVVAELQWQGLLVPVGADRFVLRPEASSLSGALAQGAAALKDRKPLSILGCISLVPAEKIRTVFLEELVETGALSRKQERHFVIFRRTRWRSQPGSPKGTLIEHLQQHVTVTPRHSPPSREDLLLSLLRGTKLLRSVWAKEALEREKGAIDQCTARAPIGRAVRRLTAVREQFENRSS